MNQHLTLDELIAFDPGSHPKPLWRRFCCPTCGLSKPRDESHRSLVVARNYFKCHRCGWQGRFGGDTQINFDPEELERIREEEKKERRRKRQETHKRWRELYYCEPGTDSFSYLMSRGISPTTIEENHDEICRSEWATERAVCFASKDDFGTFQGYQERYFRPSAEHKMKSHGPIQSGAFWAMQPQRKHDCLCIVEAPIDALSLYQMGYNALAVFGCNIPFWVKSYAIRNSWTCFLASDNDTPGEDAARKWQYELEEAGVECRRYAPPEGYNDWNDVIKHQHRTTQSMAT